MDISTSQRSLRTIQDLMNQETRRAQQRQQAMNQGIEQYVKVQEAKSKIVIEAITSGHQPFRAKA